MDLTWSFDVTVSTHDLVKAGVTAARLPCSQHHHHRVVVSAPSRHEASLLAAQMASFQGMVTGIYDRV